jgi:hypothetical protein
MPGDEAGESWRDGLNPSWRAKRSHPGATARSLAHGTSRRFCPRPPASLPCAMGRPAPRLLDGFVAALLAMTGSEAAGDSVASPLRPSPGKGRATAGSRPQSKLFSSRTSPL